MESIFNLYWALRVLRYAMPILANSPSVFQSFMNDIFRDMLDRRVSCTSMTVTKFVGRKEADRVGS